MEQIAAGLNEVRGAWNPRETNRRCSARRDRHINNVWPASRWSSDGDVYGALGRGAPAVAHGVGERISSNKVQGRRVEDSAAVELGSASLGTARADSGDDERIPIRIAARMVEFEKRHGRRRITGRGQLISRCQRRPVGPAEKG
jgi:hypothetical protein